MLPQAILLIVIKSQIVFFYYSEIVLDKPMSRILLLLEKDKNKKIKYWVYYKRKNVDISYHAK